MNNAGTAIQNNNRNDVFRTDGAAISELVEHLMKIDINSDGTAKVNVNTIGDNNGGRIKI